MYIKQLKVSNFRSIEQAEISLAPLSLIVGANAAGKSNLINVFRFIKDIVSEGIDNAIALQGGTVYLSNVRAEKGTPIEIRFVLDVSDEKWYNIIDKKEYALMLESLDYSFSIQPNKKGNGYRISEDHLIVTSSLYSVDLTLKGDSRYTALNTILEENYQKRNVSSSYQYHFAFDTVVNQDIKEMVAAQIMRKIFLQLANDDKKELMLNRIELLLPPMFSGNIFIRLFDFDPKELKKSSSMASVKMLSENGSNLASVLHEILRRRESKEKLTTLLKRYLPYVNGLSVESNIDKSFSYTIKEDFSKRSFHATYLSDGTVSIIALIIALYFENRSSIIILEEPERNIHPKLLGVLLESAEDVSQKKQVIITTHNPEFLKHARPESVRLLSRNDDGNTIVTEPANSMMVKTFMENDLGLDELFLQNLLGE